MAADHDVAAGWGELRGPAWVIGVDRGEGELGELGDVRAQRQRPGTGRGDLVGGHVIADLEQHRCLDSLSQLREGGQRGDVGPLDQLLDQRLFRRQRRFEHRGVHRRPLGQRQRRVAAPWSRWSREEATALRTWDGNGAIRLLACL